MTKKATNSQPVIASLNVDRASFKEKLTERNVLGKELLDRSVLNLNDLEKLRDDYSKWDDYNSEYLKQAFDVPNSEYKYSYDTINNMGGFFFGGGDDSPNGKLKALKKNIKNKITEIEQLIDKADLLRSSIELVSPVKKSVITTETIKESKSKDVFIVHGQNDNVKNNVARTLTKLGLNPIILHEQANSGKTIIEKFETYSNVGFAIVLMTDDDEGKSKAEVDLKNRARQNVILEMGYFIGKLGRSRIVPLYSEGVELPSDLYGLVYIPIDKAETWKFYLVKELKEAGYDVDANKLL